MSPRPTPLGPARPVTAAPPGPGLPRRTVSGFVAALPDTPEIRADFAHHYDAMATMDSHLTDRLRELESAGLAEDTIVFCYSDNGGVLPRSKRYCYDEGLRTSLIVRFPAKWQHLAPRPPGSVERGAVTSVDYAPTVLALAGVDIPHHIQDKAFLGAHRPEPARYAFGGRDRMDERYDMVRTVRDDRHRYLRNHTPYRPWGQHQAFAWNARGTTRRSTAASSAAATTIPPSRARSCGSATPRTNRRATISAPSNSTSAERYSNCMPAGERPTTTRGSTAPSAACSAPAT
ncbi:sulfatase-like hydrolase/transferase [Streptomyces sp. NPDC014685]|uniref:sulfatase-like hydrolase/transferase n=1 Tax=Streptomyces sp. NPDC014685 TaxID=3364881 RepID=UPI0036FE3868